MIRRFSRPVLANLPAILSVLPLMAFALLSTTASYLHLILPTGSNWS